MHTVLVGHHLLQIRKVQVAVVEDALRLGGHRLDLVDDILGGDFLQLVVGDKILAHIVLAV